MRPLARIKWETRVLGLCTLLGLLGCAAPAGVNHTSVCASVKRVERPPLSRLAMLLPSTEVFQERGFGRYAKAVERAGRLLQTQLSALEAEPSAESQAERDRLEQLLDAQLRVQEVHRQQVTELVLELLDAGDGSFRDVVPFALAGLLLEDLASLEGGLASRPRTVFADGDVESLSVQLSAWLIGERAEGPLAFALDAFELCVQRAADQAPRWQDFCAARRQRVFLLTEGLPVCTSAAVSTVSAPAKRSAPTPTHAQLTFQGLADVPLLADELQQLMRALHRNLGARLALPLLPLAPGAELEPPPPACEPAPEQVVRWYGVLLHCGESSSCVLSVCGDGEAGCFRARGIRHPERIRDWLEAVSELQPDAGVLLFDTESRSSLDADSRLESPAWYGGWADHGTEHGDAFQVLAELSASTLACRGAERLDAQWVLQLDRSGRVDGWLARDDGMGVHGSGLDGTADGAEGGQQPWSCLAKRLSALRFAPAFGGAPRRIGFSLAIPARVPVELSVTSWHTPNLAGSSGESPLLRLGRDRFALGLAACAAEITQEPLRLGVCFALDAGGGIHELQVDPLAGKPRRVLAQLAHGAVQLDADPWQSVSGCVRALLEEVPFGCAKPSVTRHAAFTVAVPQTLLARF